MRRILFSKTGDAIWISHLDLMRVLQRAFRRAGLLLRHTEGFNPHAFVSLALPLSVGTESRCEILEFDLAEGQEAGDLVARLNRALPAGIRCLASYEGGRKFRDLAQLEVRVLLQYDGGVPSGAAASIEALLTGPSLPVEKKSKSGWTVADIRPMILRASAAQADGTTVAVRARICAQNPSLNPDLLARAVAAHRPELAPDFAKSFREEVYAADGALFR